MMNTSSMHGNLLTGVKGPFSLTQWAELQQQALIYKYITANIPVPSSLLLSLKKSFFPYGSRPPNSCKLSLFFIFWLYIVFSSCKYKHLRILINSVDSFFNCRRNQLYASLTSCVDWCYVRAWEIVYFVCLCSWMGVFSSGLFWWQYGSRAREMSPDRWKEMAVLEGRCSRPKVLWTTH